MGRSTIQLQKNNGLDSKRLKKLVLSKKDRTLLQHSEIIKDYPWVSEFLEIHERITMELVNSLEESKQNFFTNMISRLIKQAGDEWRGDEHCVEDLGPDKEKWKKCSLCGQPNRNIFYIVNKINGIRLNVGSECIKHFGIVVKQGISIDELLKQAARIRIQSMLNARFPGSVRIIEGWNYQLNEYPIIIPSKLETPYNELGFHVKKLYNDLGKKPDENIFHQIGIALKERESMIANINLYVKEKGNDKFIPSKSLEHWLKANGGQETLNMIKDQGYITWGTAHRIEQSDFMNSLTADLNRGFEGIGLKIEKVDSEFPGYVIKPFPKKDYWIICRHHKLILDYGWIIFAEEPIEELSVENIVNLGSSYGEKSISYILDEFSYRARKVINIKEYDFNFDEVLVFENTTQRYFITKLKAFAETFKFFALGLNKSPIEEIKAKIEAISSKRYTKKELEDFELPRWMYIKE